jgi:cell growth-regulating nucleolar protein
VQGHNQCITEAEKYGPKGQSKSANGTPAKPKDISKQEPDFDINVGLSNRYPWFCRYLHLSNFPSVFRFRYECIMY